MPRKPLAIGLPLAVAILTLTACSGSDDTPTPGGKSTGKSTTGQTTTPADTKLKRYTDKGDIKNVIVKTDSGKKVSLASASPGHDVEEQVYDPDAKTWSAPTSVFKDDARFCHAIKAKSNGETIAATVTCSISAKDVNGNQSSYVVGSTDGKTWKRMDLSGVTGKPMFSPNGSYVAWSSDSDFLIWNPKATFKTVKFTQSDDTPTMGAMLDSGVLLLMTAIPGKKDVCTVSFQSATYAAPAVKTLNSTLPQAGHPHCVATSAKVSGANVIGNFDSTSTTKDSSGKKVTKTTTFALAFHRLATGKWIVVTP